MLNNFSLKVDSNQTDTQTYRHTNRHTANTLTDTTDMLRNTLTDTPTDLDTLTDTHTNRHTCSVVSLKFSSMGKWPGTPVHSNTIPIRQLTKDMRSGREVLSSSFV